VKFRVIGTLKVLLINGKKLSIGIDQNSWYRIETKKAGIANH
jgi:hypothetical protein